MRTTFKKIISIMLFIVMVLHILPAMAEGDGDTEVVAETLRTGYYYEGEVLRPAMVKVVRK